MASNVSVPNSFTNGVASDADDVNANFAALVAWINTNAVHLDGAKAFTGVPSGPATDPTTANQLARKSYVDKAVPPGTVFDFAGTSAPSGSMVCDGSAVSRSTYSDLFAAIGTTWGVGDGATTFNLPDLRGVMLVGRKSSDSDFATVGLSGGQKTVAAHDHTLGSHVHTGTVGAGTAHTHDLGSHTHTGTTGSGGSHTHNQKVWNQFEGNTGSYNGLRPESASTFVSSNEEGPSDGAHTHTFTSAAASGNTGSESAHTHTVTVDAASGNTGSSGAGTTNMNPFAVVLKVIKY